MQFAHKARVIVRLLFRRELARIESAYSYGRSVVQKLMVHRELRTRYWHLAAYDDGAMLDA